jgi:hypothetical protein
MHPIVLAALVLAPYGICYFGVAMTLGVDEARSVFRRLLRR